MKTLSQQLKQAFGALEFSNISQLNELNAKLNSRGCGNEPAVRAGKSKVVSQRASKMTAPAKSAHA